MDLETLTASLERVAAEASGALADVGEREAAIQIKNRYLGRKGELAALMGALRSMPPEQRAPAGQASNRAKGIVERAFRARIEAIERAELARRLADEAIDVTLPARRPSARGAHPLTRIADELTDTFRALGYAVAEGPEIEEDLYNFEMLNFPEDHPARDMQDTFMLEGGGLLRTHTSPVQIRTLLAYEPPIQVAAPGRVYRNDHDATHSPVFHQVEGLLIDRGIHFGHLKGTIEAFVERLFGAGVPVRFRPSFFPFTEPSAEADIGCVFCDGDGCRVCSQTGWIEILGCGMVDPNVLTACGVDPDEWSGFAFGIGIDRVAMLRYGIDHVRYLFENDLEFLAQFP